MAAGVFVTATDTAAGKTLVAAALMLALTRGGYRVAGMKPVATGSKRRAGGFRNTDALVLQSCAGKRWPYAWINPYAFAPPVAPQLAAAAAWTTIRMANIAACYRRLAQQVDCVVVEGIGGWQVPLSRTLMLSDIPRRLDLPVILVVGLRLGCINHALLTAAAIAAQGARFAGWIANRVDARYRWPAETVASLRRRIKAPLLAEIPYLKTRDPVEAAACFSGEIDRRLNLDRSRTAGRT
jgi:dethiobiotin synthetase